MCVSKSVRGNVDTSEMGIKSRHQTMNI